MVGLAAELALARRLVDEVFSGGDLVAIVVVLVADMVRRLGAAVFAAVANEDAFGMPDGVDQIGDFPCRIGGVTGCYALVSLVHSDARRDGL